MNCMHARKLFAAFWDDETTQAEREWLEGHFASCEKCRTEYEQYARTLEVLGSLPRVEPAAGLHERVLQRVRRSETVPDRMPSVRPVWVPVTSAAAAAVLIVVTLIAPWLGAPRGPLTGSRERSTVTQPVLVQSPASRVAEPTTAPGSSAVASNATALTDSLFDHSEDVEFVLDPVTLHRGRASVSRSSGGARDDKAVITF